MTDNEYAEKEQLQKELNQRNLNTLVEYVKSQKQQLEEARVEIEQWKKTIANYVLITTDLQREVSELRSAVLTSKFDGGATA